LIYVKVRKGQSIDKALSILKKKVKESKLMVELREREFYTKPSDIRKEKKAKARLRNKKDLNN
jgi:small subunit ribosomal protein S21